MKKHDYVLRFIPAAEGAALYEKSVRPALLQSPVYAASYGAYRGWSPQSLAIDIDGQPAGLAQTLTRRHCFFHAVTLDQGPVWMSDYGRITDYEQFFTQFARLFPAGLTRRRRIIPACTMTQEAQIPFGALGLRRVAGSSYATIWLDLENELRLRKNWRNMLVRAHRNNITIEWDQNGRTLEWLLRHEGQARQQKNYPGPSAALIRALAPSFIEREQFIVGRALCAGRPVAGALFILHPPAATYQLAWTGPEGRRTGAQNLLLHEGLRILKARHIRYLDLGGINEVSARNVAYFKEGLGGEIVHQSGIYR